MADLIQFHPALGASPALSRRWPDGATSRHTARRIRGVAMKAEMDRALQAAVTDGRGPGIVAIASNGGGTVYQGAFGRRGLDEDAAMTMDTVFRTASMTKAVTGVAAMQCVERG